MKVQSNTSGVSSQSATQAGDAGRAKGTSAKVSAPGGGSSAVQLSPLSARLKELASSLSGPEFDRAKVDEIKQAIRDGKLAIKPDAVADRMIADVKDRIAKGGK